VYWPNQKRIKATTPHRDPEGHRSHGLYNIVKVNGPSGTEKAVSILAIRFEELHGQKVSNPDRPVVPCSTFNGRVKALDGSTD